MGFGWPWVPTLIPGFQIFAWSVRSEDYCRLKVGMQVAFIENGYRVGVLTGVSDSAFTYVHNGVEASKLFSKMFNKAFLFVASPVAYMRFVGRDRYTGDLTDLLPLKGGQSIDVRG